MWRKKMNKIIFTKNQFINYVKKTIKKDPAFEPSLEECKKAIEKQTIGADALSIAFTILWLKEDIRTLQRRNRKSRNMLIKWLKSEMRWYADLGSFNPFVRDFTNKYFIYRKEYLEKEERK
jgi:hypothetical protein